MSHDFSRGAPRVGAPNAVLGGRVRHGRIRHDTTAGDPRVIQLALKVMF